MFVHKPTKSLIFKSHRADDIVARIPRARKVLYNNDEMVQVRIGLDEMRVLRNMDIPAPSPIHYDYDWPGKFTPFAHQRETASFLSLNSRAICLDGLGTGKSMSTLWAADYLMSLGVIKRAVIVTPLSTVDSVWSNEIRSNFLANRRCNVLIGSKSRRLAMLEREADFYVVNHDGLPVISDALRQRKDINLWIVDEAAAFRNSNTNRHKLLRKCITPETWLWMLTGTPCPNAPTDAWGLARLLGNDDIPKYFTAYKREVMHQITQFKWVPKQGAYKRAYEILQPGIRHRKEDCIDLPPVTFQARQCELTPIQQRAYKDMLHKLVTAATGKQVTAANAAVQLSKLLQIGCGVLYDGEGGRSTLDASPRMTLVEEVCEEAANKVIIFVPFTAALNAVADHLRKRWTVEVVDGSTSSTERKRIFDAFQQDDNPRILVAHPKTTAHGLTLTRADTTVWFAPIFSLEAFKQTNNRMNRPGQKNSMTVVTIEIGRAHV